MKGHSSHLDYTIKDIIDYRNLTWSNSKDFLYLTEIPVQFESDFVKPDFYCFGMITQGCLEISIKHRPHILSTNSLMVYRPGQVWKVDSVKEGTIGSFVLFNKRFLSSLHENIFSLNSQSFLSEGVQTLIKLKENDKLIVRQFFDEIFSIFHHLSETHWEAVARNLTSALIYEIDNLLSSYIKKENIPSKKDDEIFIKFNDLLTEHYKTQRKVEYYGSQLCVTPNYLYSVIKRKCGQSPTELVIAKVISEAKFMISYTSLNFSEIAQHLNFPDPFTFSKYFKKSTGYSPSQYRKHAALLISVHEN